MLQKIESCLEVRTLSNCVLLMPARKHMRFDSWIHFFFFSDILSNFSSKKITQLLSAVSSLVRREYVFSNCFLNEMVETCEVGEEEKVCLLIYPNLGARKKTLDS